jgi:LuxR family maltose regulon positive regulatory protein
VEAHALVTESNYLDMNARSLRARLLLTLNQPDAAIRLMGIDLARPSSTAMNGEYLATRALALAFRDPDQAAATAERALGCTNAVETQILGAAAQAVARIVFARDEQGAQQLLDLAVALETWDGVVCAFRAAPRLARAIATRDEYRRRLLRLLLESRDFDLAFSLGLTTSRPRAKRGPLSPREREVLVLLGQGLRTRDIAAALYISPSTVKVHISHIFEKLAVHTRAEAVARYAETNAGSVDRGAKSG